MEIQFSHRWTKNGYENCISALKALLGKSESSTAKRTFFGSSSEVGFFRYRPDPKIVLIAVATGAHAKCLVMVLRAIGL